MRFLAKLWLRLSNTIAFSSTAHGNARKAGEDDRILVKSESLYITFPACVLIVYNPKCCVCEDSRLKVKSVDAIVVCHSAREKCSRESIGLDLVKVEVSRGPFLKRLATACGAAFLAVAPRRQIRRSAPELV